METPPHYQLYIDGDWQTALTGETFTRRSPADGEIVATFERGDASDVERAVRAARLAFDKGDWPHQAGKERAEVLRRTANILRRRRADLALLESRQSGMLIGLAHTTIDWCIELFDFYAGLARQLSGRFYHHSPNRWGLVVPEPLGVVGLISPWNFPLSEMVWKIAPALAAGCTMVAKPPSLTPITILEMADILAEAGLPKGVYNVVTGPGDVVGQAIVDHPEVDLISLTGDTRTGQEIMRRAAAHTKRLTLELGGKSPHIVFADADLDQALAAVAGSIFYRCGQVCTAGSRLLIEESIHNRFVERLAQIARHYRVGDPLDPQTQMGPLISAAQMHSVLQYIEAGRREGARLVAGGQRLTDPPLDQGCYVAPTIFDAVQTDMTIAREEIFGPVLSVLTFKDEAEALHIANETPYGLAGAVWSKDLGRALRIARGVRAGTFWINQYGTIELEMPFGGFKESGFGRELGIESVMTFTELKSIHVQME